MAVENKYINSDIVAGKQPKGVFGAGDNVFALVATFEVASADDDGSVYRVFKNLNHSLIPLKIEVYNDAMTAATDYDLGLYKTNLGAAVDSEALASTLDMSSAAARTAPKNGLAGVGIDKVNKTLYELAGHTAKTKLEGYDVAFTAVTVGSAAGTITVVAWFAQG